MGNSLALFLSMDAIPVFDKIGSLLACMLCILSIGMGKAQNLQNPGEYITSINQQHRKIAKEVLRYTSAVAHNKSVRKVENSRQAVLQSIKDAGQKVLELPPLDGDKSLRDSTISYLKTAFIVMNNEYEKILDMEAIAEQTYDGMEAYLLAEELAEEHVNNAEERLNAITQTFAQKHGIHLVEKDEDEIRAKLKIASQVNAYHRTVYLIFFKSNKQEFNLISVMEKKDMAALEPNRALLMANVQEGMNMLDTLHAYQHDKSLIEAAKQTLVFYQKECAEQLPLLVDFLKKEDAMARAKETFDTKKDQEKTKEVVDAYNRTIRDFNTMVTTYNEATKNLNQERTKVVTKWEKASLNFLDKHVP